MTNIHIPVLLDEAIEYLKPAPGKIFIDCTLGGGGHTLALAERVAPDGKVLAVDLDKKAIESFQEKIADSKFKKNIEIVHGNFVKLIHKTDKDGFEKVDGILMDLGLSSNQLADDSRGFSFMSDGPLDLRFDTDQDLIAADVINNCSIESLKVIFKEYGEERLALPIAREICKLRKNKKIETSRELAKIVEIVYKRFFRGKSFKNPATKVFQALRIQVNDELEGLSRTLFPAARRLKPGGRLVVISFHSLEDKIVKEFFKKESVGCICPKELPLCVCGHEASIKVITKKPIEPKQKEIINNLRARSAKMRVAEKI